VLGNKVPICQIGETGGVDSRQGDGA
jgi:hypothetical protein